MRVNSTLIREEVFIDCEGGSDGTVCLDILLDVANSTETIAGASGVIGISLSSSIIFRVGLGALRLKEIY